MERRFIFILVLCGFFVSATAITPPLEREISMSLNAEPVRSALAKIQEQTGLVFSYRPSILENLAPVSLELRQKTVREALALMLPKHILFKQKNNYIILKERPQEKNLKKVELSGYVIDKNTEKKVPNVTIYDKNTLKSVTTDEYGYYTITLPNDNQCLKVNKENYRDTCVPLSESNNLNNISIDHLADSVLEKDTVNWRMKIKDFSRRTNDLFRKFKGYVTTLNVKDSFSRPFQVSLVPFLGSNGLLSGNVNNDYSFNIFGGYSRGTNILEVGGFFNVDKKMAKGAQLAGFFNVVGDSLDGVQLAGFFNVTGRKVKGVQAAGFVNSNFGDVTGFQGAGFLNFNLGTLSGFQVSGLGNINSRVTNGISLAGIANINRYSVQGVQLAGFTNITGDTLEGVSMAGLTNFTWYSKRSLEVSTIYNYARTGDQNVQVSGFVNSTPRGSSRIQVSVFYNRTKKLTGMQLGLLNIADTASGVPIGFLSIVKKGLHQVEVSSDELFHGNVSVRTGVNAFYNVFTVSRSTRPGPMLWSIGYGFGSSFRIASKLRADAGVTCHHVSVGDFYSATSELYRFYFGFEYRFSRRFCLAAGPTFNLYWSDALLPDYKTTYNQIAPYYSYNYNLPYDFNLKGWYGARIAFRFF